MPSRIAAIICTMNRPADLAQALASLAKCDPLPAEIIVSDDSQEADRRSEIVCSAEVGVCYQRGPRRGLGANRNAAVTAVKAADWLHFIDDDVIVPSDFYEKALHAIEGSTKLIVISGHERRHDAGKPPSRVVPPQAGFWAHLLPPGPNGGNCVVINASLFPRRLFADAAFDERLRYGCEEIDFSRQVEALGYRLMYVSDLSVDHYPSPANRAEYLTTAFASTLYAGMKHHLFRKKRPGVAATFAMVAIPRAFAYNVRRHGFRAIPQLVRQTIKAASYLKTYARTRSERTVEAS